MKMVPCDYHEILKSRSFKPTKWQKVIDEFLDSGNTCAEVVDYTNKDAKSCRGAIDAYIHRHKLHNTVTTSSRGGRVFLIRTDKIKWMV